MNFPPSSFLVPTSSCLYQHLTKVCPQCSKIGELFQALSTFDYFWFLKEVGQSNDRELLFLKSESISSYLMVWICLYSWQINEKFLSGFGCLKSQNRLPPTWLLSKISLGWTCQLGNFYQEKLDFLMLGFQKCISPYLTCHGSFSYSPNLRNYSSNE